MGLEVTFSFESSENKSEWADIVEGLARGEVGVILQERFNFFGQTAADMLDNVLDEYPAELFMADGCHIDNGHFQLVFEWPLSHADFPEKLRCLFELCGARNIRFDTFDLSGDMSGF